MHAQAMWSIHVAADTPSPMKRDYVRNGATASTEEVYKPPAASHNPVMGLLVRSAESGRLLGRTQPGPLALLVVVVVTACNVTADPGGATDTATGTTATTTAVDAGDDSLGATSGLPTDSTIASLSFDDAATLCDWVNGKEGGYGRPLISCSDGSKGTDGSQIACVNEYSALGNRCLDLTVGTIEDCVNQTGTDLCLEETTAECMTIKTCGL
jgi:hypothetical protein